MTTSNEHRTQLLHWQLAIERLARLEDSASAEGWIRLERQSNAVIRSSLRKTIAKLHRDAQRLSDSIGIEDNEQIASRILRIREDYLRTEKVVNFFADAINTRSSEKIGNVLRGLDRIASEGMNRILGPLGYSTPPVLVFKDAGLGAAIMRSGQYLWDRRSINPVAAIKVVGHNLYTATSILHELGHQVSHMTGWKKELGDALQRAIPGDLGAVWRSWSSEVSADAIALVFAGHASIAALRNVVDGGPRRVFQFHTGDPHPIGMLRVLMTCRFARLCLGGGLLHPATDNADETAPWLSLESAWRQKYPLRGASDSVQRIIAGSDPLLPTIAK
ncbi:MAG: hypothetical protein OEZ11_09340, partial [Gammaproteobacteria bacterium]|nr:hypothetical protein [Gammaproteobacteria bacterium]